MAAQDTYKPPPGFDPEAFYEEASADPNERFDYPSLSQGLKHNKQQLWVFKLPQGLKPSELDGLVIPLKQTGKTSKSDSESKAIASFIAGAPLKDDPAAVASYDLHELQQVASSSSKNPDSGTKDVRNHEMASLKVLVPNPLGAGGGGNLTFAPQAPSRFFNISYTPPSASSTSGSSRAGTSSSKVGGTLTTLNTSPSKTATLQKDSAARELEEAVARRKAKKQQPWARLQGSFAPAGASTSTEDIDAQWRQTLLYEPPPEAEPTSSPQKRRKVEKGIYDDDVEDIDMSADITGHQSQGSSASPQKREKKEKKKKDKEDGDEKAKKKRKKDAEDNESDAAKKLREVKKAHKAG